MTESVIDDAVADPPLAWNAEALWQRLEPLLPGLSVEVVARLESTNSHLLHRLRGSHPGGRDDVALPGRRSSDMQPCLLVAEHQTAGRGRLGRQWQSGRGTSLTFSLALPLRAEDWSGLSLVVGIALAEALEPAADPDAAPSGNGRPAIGLKWPNDLWLDDRKLGGILVETLVMGAQRVAVIGIGLNVLPMPVPPLSSGYACLREVEASPTAPSTLHRVAEPLVRALREFEQHGFAGFAERYARRDVLDGQVVRSGSFEGTALGVTSTGALRVLTEAGEQLVTSNEVSVRVSPWNTTTQSGLPC